MFEKRLDYPIMRAFEKCIEGYYPKSLPGGRMSKALAYTTIFLCACTAIIWMAATWPKMPSFHWP